MKKNFWGTFLRGLYRYLLFFVLVAVLASCMLSVFTKILASDLGVELTGENLNRAAKSAFLCVIVLSLVITTIDILRRKLTTEKVTKRVTAAARQIVQGDFDIRIAPTARFATDDNYNELIDCFNRMAEELSGVETLRSDFIANVSHEMKTPLAAIQNYGTLLQMPDLSEEKRLEYAKSVSDGARRLSDMMMNILKLNRLENQTIYPQMKEFDLSEQLCRCLLEYENVWEQEGIEPQTELAENVTVRADEELLRPVWNNLLSNAFKFTPSGGTVTVSLTADEEYATVRISDTGCGMTGEVGSHIFEKFYQGDPSHATQGNGLGLALVKRVIDILKAEISVESTLGVGSTFTVRLRRNLR